jgi:hypothetical protein
MKRRIGIGLAITAATWPVIITYLSVHGIVPNMVEFGSYWFAILLLIFARSLIPTPAKADRGRESFLTKRRVLVSAALMLAAGWLFSNNLFYLWKLQATSQKEWDASAEELRRIADHATSFGLVKIDPEVFTSPPLSCLGLMDDFTGAFFVKDPNRLSPPPVVWAVFGYKSRTWGLVVGQKGDVRRNYEVGKCKQVGTNVYFFVGTHG